MAFNRQPAEPEVPTRMSWDGTPASAEKIQRWARDEAFIAYAQHVAGSENNGRGTMRVLTDLDSDQGHEWVALNPGDTITNEGTWVDPKFAVRTRQSAAAVFDR